MNGYFISHPLRSDGEIPGRYPLLSNVEALDKTGQLVKTRHKIIGDAYKENELGPNMDPCIYSNPLPWCWSYCRMTSTGGNKQRGHNLIVDATKSNKEPLITSRLLNSEVNTGDIIFFGYYNFESKPNEYKIRKIWVDAVFVVKEKERWKTSTIKKNHHELKEPPRNNLFTNRSDIWRYHFEDHKFSHKFINVGIPYYSFFASMYYENQESYYSYLPSTNNGKAEPFSLLKDYLIKSEPIDKLCEILQESKRSVKKFGNDVRRPIKFDYKLAELLWKEIGNRVDLRIVSAEPTKSIKPFTRPSTI